METKKKFDVSYLESQLIGDVNNSKKVLGVKWDMWMSLFSSFKKINELAQYLESTKTDILKISETFYGSLGIISPVTARVKSIF